MVTSTTSTTATPTPTPAATPANAQSVMNAATQSLLKSLEAGSGIDTGTLVPALVTAQFAARTAALKAKSDTLAAQISGVSTLKSTMTGFSTALANLVKGGSLQTQPSSSNGAVLSATAISGAKLSTLSASVTVTRLATAQVSRTTTAVPAAQRSSSLDTGALTLTIGGGTGISIAIGNGSIDAIAAGINASKSGVTASVVTDANGGAYLSVKGGTGAAQAFTLKGDGPSGAVDIGGGSTQTSLVSTAQNALLTVDGIDVERPSNTISDLVDGVKLQLNAVSTIPVTLGSSTPTDALAQAVNDVVTTFNEVLATITEQTDPITGSLRSDPAATALLRSLKALVSKPLVGGATGGIPRTLSEIGVATNTNGTLRVDTALLTRQIAAYPDTIESMFAPSSTNVLGLSGTLSALTNSANNTSTGLGASTVRYTAAEADVTEQQDKVTDQSAQLTTRLTQQYASMNSRVTAYKSTQAFLTNQIAAWNKSS